MTLADKANVIALYSILGEGTSNEGTRVLCLPALTIADGPDGLANRLTGVTQFPSALDVAASFDSTLTRAEGQALGEEAAAKGVDVLQGPDLNLDRVATSGRNFETFGEDPQLTADLGVAFIRGIQSQGVLAMAKHFTGYTQETARSRLNQLVSLRALAELYDVPFRAAVTEGHVASVMCALGKLNGLTDCASPFVYRQLRAWGFSGFVRSDLSAVPRPAAALRAGLDLVKPLFASQVVSLVRHHHVPLRDVNRAVTVVLATMFRYGLFTDPRVVRTAAAVTSPQHVAVALRAAEEGIVLLKNSPGVLPLSPNNRSVAIIGDDAARHPLTSGAGSSEVIAPFVSSPLSALRAALPRRVAVTFATGGTSWSGRWRNNNVVVVSSSRPAGDGATDGANEADSDKQDIYIENAPDVSSAVATATRPGTGPNWRSWTERVRAIGTGLYDVVMQQVGDSWLRVNGRTIIASPGLHTTDDIASTLFMRRGRSYTFHCRYFAVDGYPAPGFSITYATNYINQAVARARHASVAVVFVGKLSTEGADASSLSLPGDANALISAVAAVNHRTIVVLNTGGAVSMPWLHRVAAVVEAWYPGEEDGKAIAAVLTGAYDPSGRLPLTFPTSGSEQPTDRTTSFPGDDATVNFGGGAAALDLGYRWYEVHHIKPLFMFGDGLSYTTFRIGSVHVDTADRAWRVRYTVSNVGHRAGTDVVQLFVRDPIRLHEPPLQLRAFTRSTLLAGQQRTVTVSIPWSSVAVWHHGELQVMGGRYAIAVGQSLDRLVANLHTSIP